jgi:hypothetical protein
VLGLGTDHRRAASWILAASLLPTVLRGAGQTVLQEVTPLVWVILAIAVGGAIITFAFMAYAFWKFQDPATKGRRYG